MQSATFRNQQRISDHSMNTCQNSPKLIVQLNGDLFIYVPFKKMKDLLLPMLLVCPVIFVSVISLAKAKFLCTSLFSPLAEYTSMFETQLCG